MRGDTRTHACTHTHTRTPRGVCMHTALGLGSTTCRTTCSTTSSTTNNKRPLAPKSTLLTNQRRACKSQQRTQKGRAKPRQRTQLSTKLALTRVTLCRLGRSAMLAWPGVRGQQLSLDQLGSSTACLLCHVQISHCEQHNYTHTHARTHTLTHNEIPFFIMRYFQEYYYFTTHCFRLPSRPHQAT